MPQLRQTNTQVIVVSTDTVDKLKKFRKSLGADYIFVADSEATLVEAYDLKMFMLTVAKRAAFVIGPERKILRATFGSDAIETSTEVASCGDAGALYETKDP